MIDERQEQELISGGPTALHFHPEDRTPTQDTLSRFQDLEIIVEVSTTYAARPQDDIILGDTTSGGFTITLAPANRGKRVIVERIAGGNNLTVAPHDPAVKINGVAASVVISTSFAPIRLKAYGGNWINA